MKKIIRIYYILSVCMICLFSFTAQINAEEKKPIKMVFATYLPTKHHIYNNVLVPFAQDVEKSSQGLITFDMKSGGALGKSSEIIHTIGKGIADLGQSYAVYHASILPLTNVTTLPGILQDSVVGSVSINQLYKKMPEIKAEWEKQNVYPLALAVAGGRGIISNVPFRKTADAKNIRVQVSGKQYATIWKTLGARPVVGDSGEMYQNIQKGVVDGGSASWASLPGYSLHEVAKFATHVPWGFSPFYLAVNKNVWEKLPQWAKDTLQASADKTVRWVGESYNSETIEATEIFKKNGVEVINLPSDEIAHINDLLKPVYKEWADSQPNPEVATRVLDEFKKLVKQNSK